MKRNSNITRDTIPNFGDPKAVVREHRGKHGKTQKIEVFYGGVTGEADAAITALVNGKLAYDPNIKCAEHHDCGGDCSSCGSDCGGCAHCG